MPELDDRELAALVLARLEARQPRRLPERFVPPAPRPHRARWAVLAVAAAIVLGLAATVAVRPELGSAVLSSLVERLPGAHAASPTPAAPAPSGRRGRPGPSGSPQGPDGGPTGGSGSGGGATASPASTPVPGAGLPMPLPSLPPGPLPVPTPSLPLPSPSLPPLPLPTPSLPHLQ